MLMRNTKLLITLLAVMMFNSASAIATPSTVTSANGNPPVASSPNRPPVPARRLFTRAHIDFVAKSERFKPMLEASVTSMPDTRVRSEPGHFDLRQLKADALVPIPLDQDTFLLLGFSAGSRDYNFDDVPGAGNDTLYHLGLRIGGGRYVTENLVLRGYWQPSLNADLDDGLSSDDFNPWLGDALAIYRTGENVFIKAGLIFTDAFNSVVVPAGGVSWIFAPDWRLDALLPRNTEISFMPNANWQFHGGVELEGLDEGKYRVTTSTPAGKEQHEVRVQEARAFLGAIYRFNLNLSSFIKAGAAVGGDYDWDFTGGFDYNGSLEPSPFVQAGLGWYFF
jgi:hypothetical protein